MVTTLTVLSAMRRAEACCPLDACDYTPERIRKFLNTIQDLKGECSPIEAIRSVHFRRRERGLGQTSDLGPGSRSESAARVVADLVRAIQAGKRDEHAISRYLCPLMNLPPVDEDGPSALSLALSGQPVP